MFKSSYVRIDTQSYVLILAARSVFCVRHFLVTSLKILGALQPCHLNYIARSAEPETVVNEAHVYSHRISTFMIRLTLDYRRKVQENHEMVELDGYVRCMLMAAILICLLF